MATGRMAFPGNTAAVVHDAILNRAPIPLASLNPSLPPTLGGIIDKALEKDRNLRYRNAEDIRTALQQLKGGSNSAGLPTTEATTGSPLQKRWRSIVLAAIAVAALVAGSYLYSHRTPKLTKEDIL